MQSRFQVYNVTLEVKGPVFIGSGQKLKKKEYIGSSNSVIIPNLQKMFEDLRLKHLDRAYEEFLNNNNSLTKWLNEKIKLGLIDKKTIGKWKLYELNKLDVGWNDRAEINLFIKDAYGKPYVPGSSIKGMLRTILLAYDICNNREKYRKLKEEIEEEMFYKRKNKFNKMYLKKQTDGLEIACFNRLKRLDEKEKDVANAVNSIMSKIIIGDSEPLALDDLILCQKKDRTVEMKADNNINTLSECLKPGTKISFAMTIDTKDFPYTVSEIEEAVKLFADISYEYFISKFHGVDRPMDNTVWLGGGAGYVSKTITYALFQKKGIEKTAEILEKQFNGKHGNDKKASPHMIKMTQYQGKDYCFGECLFYIEEKQSSKN